MTESLVQFFLSLKSELSQLLVRLAPRLTAVLLAFAVAWVFAKTASWVTGRMVPSKWLERVVDRSGILSMLLEPSIRPSGRLPEKSVYTAILISGVVSALALLSNRFAGWLQSLLFLAPMLLLAIAILTVAWLIGGRCARATLIWTSNEGLRFPWRWAALVRCAVSLAGIALSSEATGFATNLVRNAFLILLAGATLTAGRALTPVLRSAFTSSLLRDRSTREGSHPDDPLFR